MKRRRALAIVHSDTDVPGSLPELASKAGVEVEVRSITRPLVEVSDLDLLVVMGSPESAYDERLAWLEAELGWLRAAQQRGVPTLGICFGSQILARSMGGQVSRNARAEIGWTPLRLTQTHWQHAGPWLNFHFDAFTLPPGAELLAETDLAPQAYRIGKSMGVQFHPEIDVAMFDTWTRYWASTAEGRQFLETAGDLPERMRAEIAARQPENRANCLALIEGFLAQA